MSHGLKMNLVIVLHTLIYRLLMDLEMDLEHLKVQHTEIIPKLMVL
jgi:hypothetical protein